MLEQLCMYLAAFLLFPNNLRAVLNILKQLHRYLAIMEMRGKLC